MSTTDYYLLLLSCTNKIINGDDYDERHMHGDCGVNGSWFEIYSHRAISETFSCSSLCRMNRATFDTVNVVNTQGPRIVRGNSQFRACLQYIKHMWPTHFCQRKRALHFANALALVIQYFFCDASLWWTKHDLNIHTYVYSTSPRGFSVKYTVYNTQ